MKKKKIKLVKPAENTPETNMFGGKNPLGLYVPMTEDEMDALDRMIQSKDLELIIHGWGRLENPRIKFGDLRVCIEFRLDFNAPEKLTELHFLDLELRIRGSHITMFKKRMATHVNGKPVLIKAGMFLELAWDIAIDHISPELVKMYLPGLHGMTSRRMDKDTGERTLTGNMKLTESQKNHIRFLEQQNAKLRQNDVEDAVKATKRAGYEVKNTPDGPEAPDID